jgi:hypothetical protein
MAIKKAVGVKKVYGVAKGKPRKKSSSKKLVVIKGRKK